MVEGANAASPGMGSLARAKNTGTTCKRRLNKACFDYPTISLTAETVENVVQICSNKSHLLTYGSEIDRGGTTFSTISAVQEIQEF